MRYMVRAGTRTATAVALVLGVSLLVVGCGGSGGSGGQSQSSGVSVSSSIADGAKLRGALRWTAKPESDADSLIAKVDFLIDGKREWTEENTPFFFNDDKQLLATWLLEPGQHTLAVRAETIDGKTAQSAAQVTVSAPPTVPDALVGTFERRVTQDDIRRTASEPGRDPSALAPTGVWTFHVGRNGLISVDDPLGGGTNEAITATASGKLKMWGPANWLSPPDRQGGFCEPELVGSLHWRSVGGNVTVTGPSGCADRDAVFVGQWMRRGR
jgi:hypothetical protein